WARGRMGSCRLLDAAAEGGACERLQTPHRAQRLDTASPPCTLVVHGTERRDRMTHYSLFVGDDYDPRVWLEAERLGVETQDAAPGGAGWSGENGEEPTLDEVAYATGLDLATVERLARMAG